MLKTAVPINCILYGATYNTMSSVQTLRLLLCNVSNADIDPHFEAGANHIKTLVQCSVKIGVDYIKLWCSAVLRLVRIMQ